jgi:hypothetical protein
MSADPDAIRPNGINAAIAALETALNAELALARDTCRSQLDTIERLTRANAGFLAAQQRLQTRIQELEQLHTQAWFTRTAAQQKRLEQAEVLLGHLKHAEAYPACCRQAFTDKVAAFLKLSAPSLNAPQGIPCATCGSRIQRTSAA